MSKYCRLPPLSEIPPEDRAAEAIRRRDLGLLLSERAAQMLALAAWAGATDAPADAA